MSRMKGVGLSYGRKAWLLSGAGAAVLAMSASAAVAQTGQPALSGTAASGPTPAVNGASPSVDTLSTRWPSGRCASASRR